MSDQASEAIAYIEREYEDLKGRVEDQRRVVEQLHMVETDAAEAEASLAALGRGSVEAAHLGLLANVARRQDRISRARTAPSNGLTSEPATCAAPPALRAEAAS